MKDKRPQYIAAGASTLLALAFGAALLAAGGGSTTRDKPTQVPEPWPERTPAQVEETELPADSAPEPWDSDGLQAPDRLLEIDLDPETQWAIYHESGDDSSLFCTAIAIAYKETGGTFQADAVGDEGGSIGMFQINTKWHLDRMDRLGVTDLTDPAQCAAVAIDYLKELADRYGFEPESEALLMAYNMGPGGAKKAIEAGTTSTAYSREVWALYQGYLEEMEADRQ